jgi:2-polyprenyl-3-methyl-5-hydroxy-6-metoxy-1,4-benzoquinol methylase
MRDTCDINSGAGVPGLADQPVSYEAIVSEICRFTQLRAEDVAHKVWKEALELGWNVGRDVETFGVTPHYYDEKMEALYREGMGFIFETMVYWAKPSRQEWSCKALERLLRYSVAKRVDVAELSLLLLGDGVGNDAIFFARNGFNVDYFDVPGSETYDFAVKRFEHYKLLNQRIHLIGDYRSRYEKSYDAVLSFEVLEHLPDPRAAVADIGRLLKLGGIALITESFGLTLPHLPTHLSCNARLEGRAPFIFHECGMKLSWYSRTPPFKPMEFVRVEKNPPLGRATLIFDGAVLKEVIEVAARRAKQRILSAFAQDEL